MVQTSTYDTYTGNVRTRYAFTQKVAATLEYVYYFYDFGGSPLLAPGQPTRLERNGIRGGIAIWVPMIRR